MRKLTALIISLLITTCCFCQSKQFELGDQVPQFNLPDQDGKTFNMKDSIGTKNFKFCFRVITPQQPQVPPISLFSF